MTKTDRCESRFDGIGRSQVAPVLGWEVIERKKWLSILPQAVTGWLVLRVVLLQEILEGLFSMGLGLGLPDLVHVALRFGCTLLGISLSTLAVSWAQQHCSRLPAVRASPYMI